MRIIHSVDFNELVNLDNILRCWDEFKKDKSSKGDVLKFERHLEDNLFSLHHDLMQRTLQHGRYSTFHIYDPKHRIISKVSARDRLLHHIVFEKLYEIFDKTFYYHSYSSRVGKGTHAAVRNLRDCLRKESKNYQSQVFILKCDIKKFFHSVSHRKLLQLIQNKIKDKDFLWLLEEIVNSFPNPVDKIVSGGGV
jgi:retron-type reverse transcriptase